MHILHRLCIVQAISLLCLVNVVSAGHISSDGVGGFYTPQGHVSSDGAGGYYTPQGHVSSDGAGGFYTPY